MSSHGSTKAVIYALAGNLVIAIIKNIVSFITVSAAMLAEAIHSTADSFNQILLLLGQKRAERPQSELHNLGNANEIYFWAMMVAVFCRGSFFKLRRNSQTHSP